MTWWIIENAPKPVYVGYRPGRSRRLIIISVASIIAILMNFIGTALTNVFGGLSYELLALLALISIILWLITYKYNIESGDIPTTDQILAKELVKGLCKDIVVWSIPSRDTPLAMRLKNRCYVFLFYRGQKPLILYGEPLIHSRIVGNVKSIRVLSVLNDLSKNLKRIKVVIPYPDNPTIWYESALRGEIIDPRKNDISSIIRKIKSIGVFSYNTLS